MSLLVAAGLLLASVAALPPAAGAAAPEVRVPEVEGAPAADVQVQVSLASQGEVAGIQFDLRYDAGLLTYQGVTAGGLPSGWAAAGNTVTRGRVKIMVYSLEGRTVAAGTRPVATLTFRVDADAEAGDNCALTVSSLLLANASGSGIGGARSTSGRFTVAAEEPAPNPPPAGPPSPPPPRAFSDIVGHWARDSIDTMCAQGIVGGFPDGSFRPNDLVTRAQFAKIMVNALSLAPVGGARSFRDVPATHWAYSPIQCAAPYLPGYSDGTYRPDAAALREDVAAALVRALGWEYQAVDPARLAGFTDSYSIPSALKTLVAIAVDTGLMGGYPDGSFRGKGTLTRAEACVVVLRAQRLSGGLPPSAPGPGAGVTPPPAPPPATPPPPPSAGGTTLDAYLVDAYESGRNAYLDTREPLMMGGEEYTRGVSWKVYGYSSKPRTPACVAFNLGGRFSRLTGKVGLDDRAAKFEETVRLVGDGTVLQTVKLRPGDLPASFDLEAWGLQNLRIEVENMHYNNVMDAVEVMGWTQGGTPPALGPSPQPPAGGTTLDAYLVDAYKSERDAYLDTREPLVMGGVEYTRGVSWKVYGYSSKPRTPACVAFNLGGRFSRLTGKVGLDDRAAKFEETVRLVGDGTVLKTVKLRPGDLPASFELDAWGLQNLRIEVENMHYNNVMDAVEVVGWK